jgi:hypothetical protein
MTDAAAMPLYQVGLKSEFAVGFPQKVGIQSLGYGGYTVLTEIRRRMGIDFAAGTKLPSAQCHKGMSGLHSG